MSLNAPKFRMAWPTNAPKRFWKDQFGFRLDQPDMLAQAHTALVGVTKIGKYAFVGSFDLKLPMIALGDKFHFRDDL